jgi:hypothetical protein
VACGAMFKIENPTEDGFAPGDPIERRRAELGSR